jgi:fermentation-respiration switch protein FrsA (DUF1100 family)
MNSSNRKLLHLRWAVLGGGAALALLGAALYLFATQQRFIFEPSPVLQTTPERVGVSYEELRIASGSGSERGELNGWWIPAGQRDAPTFLYLHGNDNNIGYVREVEHARSFHGMGYNLLMIDYRGYGKSTGGPPSEAKMYEDAESAWNYLIRQRGLAPQRTFIYGHSLGGAVAIDLAVRHPEAAGVVEESSFTSIRAMGAVKFGFTPPSFLLNSRFDSLSKISSLKIPLLVIHGTWDKLVPYRMGQQLFDAAPQPKTLKLIEGGEHENTCIVSRLECSEAYSSFVRKSLH